MEDRKEDKTTKPSPLRVALINETIPRGLKGLHESGNSDSDKELVLHMHTRSLNSELQLVTMELSPRGWHEVKKEKGKKGRIVDY